MKVLIYILDDSEADREFIEMAIGDQFEIASFHNPDTFKANLSNDVNIVITDVRVPGYDVYETIQYLHDYYPGIYVIVISGYFDDDTYERLFELGVDRTVRKEGNNLIWSKKVAKYVNDLAPKIELKRELLKHDNS